MLPSYFDYIFVHLKQEVRLRPELSLKFLSTLGPNPAQIRPEKPGRTYNSATTLLDPDGKLAGVSFPRIQRRVTSSGIEPGVSKFSIINPTFDQVSSHCHRFTASSSNLMILCFLFSLIFVANSVKA